LLYEYYTSFVIACQWNYLKYEEKILIPLPKLVAASVLRGNNLQAAQQQSKIRQHNQILYKIEKEQPACRTLLPPEPFFS
jgi:hypothetical protein